jgi:hypothetical protein
VVLKVTPNAISIMPRKIVRLYFANSFFAILIDLRNSYNKLSCNDLTKVVMIMISDCIDFHQWSLFNDAKPFEYLDQ